ncbi:hypothetical protein T05_6527 [Trichinella murrelli]|uniref:Uncharacterized protein n=1 Tax=Trichinella murrelli TaxID=144512 RepID=A0A0V0U1F5_9BILA|nr:hypothetical protein T05_6527 [Trichinella murrelli]
MRHADALISNLCILNPFYPSEPDGEKRDVLEKLRTGKLLLYIALSTVSNIRINEAQILSQLDGSLSKSRCRRMRKTVNAEKFQFFVRCRAKLIPISGQLLQTNAIDIARKMGIKQWLAGIICASPYNIKILHDFR